MARYADLMRCISCCEETLGTLTSRIVFIFCHFRKAPASENWPAGQFLQRLLARLSKLPAVRLYRVSRQIWRRREFSIRTHVAGPVDSAPCQAIVGVLKVACCALQLRQVSQLNRFFPCSPVDARSLEIEWIQAGTYLTCQHLASRSLCSGQ